MALTPAGIGMALAVGLAAAAAGSFVYLSAPADFELAAKPPAGDAQPSSDATARQEPPRFDLVRVAPDGAGLAAGRAAPGTRVRIRSGETTLAEVETGPSGEFAAIFRVEPGDTPQVLVLETEAPGGEPLMSEEHVLLLPPSPRAEAATSGEPAPSAGWSEAAGERHPAEAPQVEPAEAAPEDAVAATAILAPGEPAEVAAALDPSAASQALSLASIDYAADGSVRLSGSAPAGSRLRVYVDDAHAGDRIADAGGRWEAALQGIEEGAYRIRVDALGEDGEVTSRVETPFQRTFPPAAGEAGTVTVQPGNNLWTIARTRYGSGMLYTQIFTANPDLIEDPDLIYPGQIFVLPEPERDGGGPQARR